MLISDVPFTINARVVHRAPFRLLPGLPFHDLLVCQLENRLERVDVFIRDPAKPSQSIDVPSRARQGTGGICC